MKAKLRIEVGAVRRLLTCVRKVSDREWEWQCKCGNKIILSGWRLWSAKCCGLSCPELNKERGASHRKPRSRTINEQYFSHCWNAKMRNLTPLPREQWEAIIFKLCHYCGDIDTRNYGKYPAYQKKMKNKLTDEMIAEFEVQMNGVDRIDSDKDYSPDNCVPCCSHCNIIKNDYSEEDFKNKVTKIYNYYVKGKKGKTIP